MRVGILGAGGIARKMAYTINNMEGVELAAIGSRSADKAKAFADEFDIPKAYGSYEELAADNTLDLIYVATPHSRHYEDCMLCLEHGRNVLCEKPFMANAEQTVKVIDFAREKGLFIAEAIWTRYLPMRFKLDEIIKSGVVGEITSLSANLGYQIAHVERLIKPELAGGALLDLGVYTINFTFMHMGTDMKKISSDCVKNEYGVDIHNSIIMRFADDKTAILHSNMNANLDNRGIINGSKGRIEFININNCEGIEVYLNDGTYTKYETPSQITGFEYEVMSCMKAISEGKLECEEMPHEEILRVMITMDGLREEWEIEYPFEK